MWREGMDAVDDETARRIGGANINEGGPYRVYLATKRVDSRNVFDGYALQIGDTRGLTPYRGGGTLTQVKQPVRYPGVAFRELLRNPAKGGGMVVVDFGKFGLVEELHVANLALIAYEEGFRRPTPRMTLRR